MSDMRSLSVENVQGSEDLDLEDLDVDMWGLTVMTIARDFADIMFELRHCQVPGGFQCFRWFYGSSCQILNIGLQLLQLYYVNLFVVRPAVHDIQKDYTVFHAEIFDPDGTFRKDLWHVWTGPWLDLCNSVMTQLTFTSVIMVLWTTRMLGEFRSAYRLWRRVVRVPSLPQGVAPSDMLKATKEDDRDVLLIVYLNHGTRVMLLLFCAIPKVAVAFILWFIGCRWLNATQSFEQLILNALALEFIVQIDEIILSNFFPDWICEEIESMKFAYPKKEDDEAADDAQAVRAYVRSFIFAFLVLGWAYMYLNYWQQVLPGFVKDINMHCQGDWFLGKFESLCSEFDTTCFPYGPPNGKPLPKIPDKRLLHDSRGAAITAASLLAEIALLPSVV